MNLRVSALFDVTLTNNAITRLEHSVRIVNYVNAIAEIAELLQFSLDILKRGTGFQNGALYENGRIF